MENVGIYKITNIINNKCYIGSSKSLKKRIYEHKRQLRKGKHHSYKLQKSWDKYGEENFKFEIICECEIHELLILEQKYFDKIQPELIILKTAGRFEGYRHTEETKKILREKRSKQVFIMTDQWKKNISDSKKGKKLSKEHREKLSQSHIGKKLSEEHKQKIRNKTESSEMVRKQKLSVLKRKENNNYIISDKHKKKISETNSVPVVAVDSYNNIKHSFSSYKDAACFLNRKEITLYRYIKSGKKINGLIWKRK